MPGVDDRLAIPETGEEYVDGVRYEVLAGEAAHADPQCQLAYVVRACVAEGYIASTELLTRSEVGSDFAADVCVRRAGEDPQTHERYLEELSFEVAADSAIEEHPLVPTGVAPATLQPLPAQEAPASVQVCATGSRRLMLSSQQGCSAPRSGS